MRNVVIGSFVGFVLAAAFLAACGGSSSTEGPQAISTPSAVKWTDLGPRVLMASGTTLFDTTLWRGTTAVDNGVVGTRNQFALFDVRADVDAAATGGATLDIGVLPSVVADTYATEPQWVSSIELTDGDNRRAVAFGAGIPPTPFRLALRIRGGGSGSVRVLQVYLQPYNEELQ